MGEARGWRPTRRIYRPRRGFGSPARPLWRGPAAALGQDGGMSSTPPNTRTVKIGQDERGGWSSDRPRPGGARPANIATRCRVLAPTDRLRYSPGSLVVIVSPSPRLRDQFVERLIEDRSALLSVAKVRKLIEGRVPDAELDERAGALLTATVAKRLASSDTVVIPVATLDAAER